MLPWPYANKKLHNMADMTFAKKVFLSYKQFYVENCNQTMEKVAALNTKQKNQITKIWQIMESKNKEIEAKDLEIKNKNKEITDLQ